MLYHRIHRFFNIPVSSIEEQEQLDVLQIKYLSI